MAELRRDIKTAEDLKEYEKRYLPLLKKNDKRAQEIDDNGQLVWHNKQVKRQIRREAARAKRSIQEVYGDSWDDMSPVQQAIVLNNSKVRIPNPDDYFSHDELKQAWDSWSDDKQGRYMVNYIQGLKNVAGSGEWVNNIDVIIKEIEELDPEFLYSQFDLIAGETSIDYLYEKSADLTLYGTRQQRVTEFWEGKLEEARRRNG